MTKNRSTMTGASCLAKTLAGYGVTHVFMVPAVLRRSMAEMERHTDILNIHTHGEKSAAYMADGYSRASGRPSVCMAQQTGALNLAAGLRDAWLARSPVIAMTGGSKPDQRFRGLYQEAEDFPAFDPYTKWNASIATVERFPDMLRQAFRVATSGNPGPVHLQFQGQEGEIDQQEGELEITIDKAFCKIPPFRPKPESSLISDAIALIDEAQKPVIVAGGGVKHSQAGDALVEFAETRNIPVVTSLNGRDTIPGTHPLSIGVVGTYSRPSANQCVHESDLVIFIGSSAGSMTTNFWRLPRPGTAVVQIDIQGETIGRNYPVNIGIQADARMALKALTAEASKHTARNRDAWVSENQDRYAEWSAQRESLTRSADVPIRPERICDDMRRLLPEDAVLVVDTGHAGMWMSSMFELQSSGQNFIRSAGHLGWAFSAGLGAKCALPDRPVITFTGDLGFWYHIAEIETAVRWGINAVTIVNNNRSGNQSKRGFAIAYDDEPTDRSRELWVHNEVNFAEIANTIGALGIRVTHPDEFGDALQVAIAANRPAIIDVVTDMDAAAPLSWDADNWVQRY
jgi:acetolactate synthase-1/2/3 large subunit